jgi:hypothetical protein
MPREYVQLHRDSTVQSLTVVPVLTDGVIRWEDSPLVKAAQNGHVLVMDEVRSAACAAAQCCLPSRCAFRVCAGSL